MAAKKKSAAGSYIDAYVSEPDPQSSGNTINIDASGGKQAAGGNAAQSNINSYVNATGQQTKDAQAQAVKDQKAAARNIGQLTSQVAEETHSFFDWASDFSLGVSTPGGIALILIAIFILIFAIVPVNDQGDTRLYLMWLTLMGQTTLKGGIDDRTANIGGVGSAINTNQVLTQGTPLPSTQPIQQQAPPMFLGSMFDVNQFGGNLNGF